jgi:hypothetical protein
MPTTRTFDPLREEVDMPRLRRSLFQSPLRRPAGAAAFAAAAALILALVVGGFVQAAAVTVGYRDFAYNGAAASRATSLPEQSKLWFNDGSWWGGLFRSSGSGTAGSHFDIFKFNAATQAWTNTTRIVDSRDHTHADYLWDGAHNKLYVVTTKSACTSSPPPPSAPCNDEVRVLRFSYNAASTTLLGYYTPDVGFPVKLAGGNYPSADGGGNAVTIAKDSKGELYVVWTRDDISSPNKTVNVYWAHSNSDADINTTTDETSWAVKAPFPLAGTEELNQDNTAAVVSFGTKVGIYWTHKSASGNSYGYFAVHNDGDSDATWSPELVTGGVNFVADQANLKAHSDGSVYAVIKTGTTNQIQLFKRSSGGGWSAAHTVSTSANGNTRAQLLLDEEQSLVYVLSSSGSVSNGTIYVKTAPLSTLTFPTGKGSTFIKSATDIAIDDVSSTKDRVDHATGLLAEATDHITFQFFHNFMSLQATDTTPPVGNETINGGAVFTASKDVTLSVPASDTGSGVALVRVSNFSSVDGGGVLNAGDATSFGWAPTVPWTLTSGDGGKTVYVQWADGQGNWSAVTSNTIWLDTTGPAGAVSIDSGASVTNSLNVTLDVTAVDAQTSTSQVRIANAATVDGNGLLSDASAVTSAYAATKSWTLAAGADGSRTVYAQWQDSLGNWSSVKNDSITVDTTPPGSGSVSINGGAAFTNAVDRIVHVALSNPGGATQVRLAESVAGLSSATSVSYTTPIDFTLAAGPDGVRTVYVQWGDDAGNFSVPDSDSIILDLRNPVGTVAINGGATGVRSLAVTLSFPASDTDIDTITVSNNSDMTGSQTFGQPGTAFSGTIAWNLAGPLTNGLTKAVYVTFHDQGGNNSDHQSGVLWSAFASTRVDLTRPVMSAPIISRWFAGTGFAGNGAPLHLNWRAATDTISGVASYTVWVSRDSRPFLLVGNTAGPAMNVIVAPGHSYRYRVAATDRAGNRSALILSPLIRPAAYQDNSRAVIYRGRWGTARSTLFYGGTDHWSSARSATATLRFIGRSVAWVAPTGLTRGSARVYADGRLVATISLRTPTAAYKRLVFARSWGRSATHTIRIVVLGTVGHPRVDLDTFLIIR